MSTDSRKVGLSLLIAVSLAFLLGGYLVSRPEPQGARNSAAPPTPAQQVKSLLDQRPRPQQANSADGQRVFHPPEPRGQLLFPVGVEKAMLMDGLSPNYFKEMPSFEYRDPQPAPTIQWGQIPPR